MGPAGRGGGPPPPPRAAPGANNPTHAVPPAGGARHTPAPPPTRHPFDHARRCLEICEEHGIGDWDLAFAHEALARAHALAGDRDAAAEHERLARAAAEEIAEDDDRAMVLADLDTLP